MSSRAGVLSGKPRVRRVPRSVSNEADDFVFLASSYGLTADGWQEDVLESWLGRRSDGRWAAATGGLAVPRQNGKNGAIEIRELGGMVALGEKFLHTAHEVKTARKAFLRIASFFENERMYPELAALAKEIRKTNGQEAVILLNGGSVEFIARSRGSGRGFTVDVLVCDEAQELTNEELEALLPTISAAPTGNPQVILTGTPPKPESEGRAQGEVFRAVRRHGEAGTDGRLAWTDFGVADGPCPDVTDRELWLEVNPALGGRLAVAEVERELSLMVANPEGFARERLGWWGDPNGSGSVVGIGTWEACADRSDPAPRPVGRVAFAVDADPDRAHAAVAVAGERLDGLPQVQVIATGRGVAWAGTAVKDLVEKWPTCAVVIDPRSAAASLIVELEEAGVTVTTTAAQDMAKACGAFYDAAVESRLRHLAQPELDEALAGAKTRPLGDAWAWDRRKPTTNITPLVASTLALWGWATRDPEPPKYASTFSV